MGYMVMFSNQDEEPIVGHSHVNPSIRLLNTRCVVSTEDISVFSFTILPDNPVFNYINPSKTLVTIIDMDDDFIEFEGRVVDEIKEVSETRVGYEYQAEDKRGFLRDSLMFDEEFKGKPSVLFKKIIDRHNKVQENDPYKQFSVGDCEIDTYREYVTADTPPSSINKTLVVGDTATIKSTAKHIYASWDGSALNMASYIKGVPLIVDAVQVVGGDTRYLLYRMIGGSKITEGIVSGKDIIEVVATNGGVTGTVTVTVKNTPGSSVRIKSSAVYWWTPGTGASFVRRVIPTVDKNRNYILGSVDPTTRRYTIWIGRKMYAWIDEVNLEFGREEIKPVNISRPTYIDKPRTIEAVVDLDDNAYDAIDRLLLKPYGAELILEKVEEVSTIHIRNRVENQTEEYIRLGHNQLNLQLSTNLQEIYSAIIPIGSPPPTTGGA